MLALEEAFNSMCESSRVKMFISVAKLNDRCFCYVTAAMFVPLRRAQRSLVDMSFIFSCSTPYLTSEHSSLVRYRVELLEIKFISSRGHVISCICILRNYKHGVPLFALLCKLKIDDKLICSQPITVRCHTNK